MRCPLCVDGKPFLSRGCSHTITRVMAALDEAREKQRTPEEEAVLRAAVAWRAAKVGAGEMIILAQVVDALLAVEPKWGG